MSTQEKKFEPEINGPPFNPFEKVDSNRYQVTKPELQDIIRRLKRIEEGLKQITGLQLINGIWQ